MKRQYNLYLDIDGIELIRAKGISNISAFLNALVLQEAELKGNQEDHNSALKLANAKLITELNGVRVEKEHLQREFNEYKLRNKENKESRVMRTIG